MLQMTLGKGRGPAYGGIVNPSLAHAITRANTLMAINGEQMHRWLMWSSGSQRSAGVWPKGEYRHGAFGTPPGEETAALSLHGVCTLFSFFHIHQPAEHGMNTLHLVHCSI
ncbi:hypothetical protein ABG768_002450 [Culter alburnus]|uniref:Uncharacterized protein n=1 Tax=Culter alburnus TaxID=194366 RepID=A0AAW2A5G5_CULAL